MIKYSCDSCKEDIPTRHVHRVDIPAWVCEGFGMDYVDGDGYATGGTYETHELCNKCFNQGWMALKKSLDL